jgi:FkbM family methyltransferase
MDLYHHTNPIFTKWIVDNKFLEERFTVIDVGCQGGPHLRWKVLGDFVDFHGFDPISEVIDYLADEYRGLDNYRFYSAALGNEDGQREFYVKSDSFSSSFYRASESVLLDDIKGNYMHRCARTVEIRKLDSLSSDACLPLADYIKIDCEGFENEVLLGARDYLATSAPLCVTTETTFATSPTHLHTHFGTLNDLLLPHGLHVFDLSYVRWPYPPYTAALSESKYSESKCAVRRMRNLRVVGRPTTFDFVFCRDFVAERDWPQSFINKPLPYRLPSVDKLIKAMINFELHGLMDCAFEIGMQFREHLEQRIDVSWALDLLLAPAPNPRL